MSRPEELRQRGIPYDEWVGLDQHQARMLAREPDVKPLAVRVMFAAIGWSNLIGHAEFAAGGLAMVLQSCDPKTGEMHIPSRNQVNTAIARAKEMGIVGDDSVRHCLRSPDWWIKSGGSGGRGCDFHGIYTRANRHKRSVTNTEKRHKRSVTATQEKCHSDDVTCGNVQPSMNLIYPTSADTLPQPERRTA